MAYFDFACRECDHVEEDLWFTLDGRPTTIDCPECSGPMRHDLGRYRGIDLTNPAMYGKYHAGFDTVVTSYGHKQQLLRESGLTESSDATKGSKCYVPGDYSESNPDKGKDPMPAAAEWAN